MRFEFGIGTGFTALGTPIAYSLRAVLIRESLKKVADVFGGCFLREGQGAWCDGEGKLVVEPGNTITADTPRGNATDGYWQAQAQQVAEWLRQAWDQEAIHLTWSVAVSHNHTAADVA